MKPKISPEQYREILKNVRLDSLYLVDLNSKYNEEYVSKSLELDIKEKHSFTQENNKLKIFFNYSIIAKEKQAEKPAMTIKCKYVVKYDVLNEVEITKDFMDIFSELTVSLLLWTYFRELVNNTIYRMGMPPLILPMRRV